MVSDPRRWWSRTVDESANRHIDSVARARFNITRPGESAPASRRREPRGENRRACRRGRRGARACVRARARMASEAPTRRGEQRVTAGSSRRFAGAKIARPALVVSGRWRVHHLSRSLGRASPRRSPRDAASPPWTLRRRWCLPSRKTTARCVRARATTAVDDPNSLAPFVVSPTQHDPNLVVAFRR